MLKLKTLKYICMKMYFFQFNYVFIKSLASHYQSYVCERERERERQIEQKMGKYERGTSDQHWSSSI